MNTELVLRVSVDDESMYAKLDVEVIYEDRNGVNYSAAVVRDSVIISHTLQTVTAHSWALETLLHAVHRAETELFQDIRQGKDFLIQQVPEDHKL